MKDTAEHPNGKNPGRVPPQRLVVLSFLLVIALGWILLMMPFSTVREGRLHPVDALFTAVSATCVTGLIVVDTGTEFTMVGKGIILILIQVGGLGLMTLSTFLLVMLGRRPRLRDRLAVLNVVGSAGIRGWKGLIRTVILTTLVLEFAGAAVLAWRFYSHYGFSLRDAVMRGAFHSVSAFCNAGFSLFPDSLMGFGSDWWITLTHAALIFMGGIGFLVLYNLFQIRFWRRDLASRGRLRLHSRLALLASLLLIVLMFFPLLINEWNHSLEGMPVAEKINRAFFQAVTPRTGGFNTMPVEELRSSSLWLTMLMMFVGASPCGTGGGIKTVTFVILVAAVFSLVAHRDRVVIFRRTVPEKTVLEAMGIVVLAAGLVFCGVVLLFCTENPAISVHSPGGYFGEILFETVSAFGTVGLSTGITPRLSLAGKLIIAAVVFMGRVGPLAVALTIGKTGGAPQATVRYPEDIAVVG